MNKKEKDMAPGETEETLSEANQRRRDMIKRHGSYAVSAPLGMYIPMSPSRSAVAASDT